MPWSPVSPIAETWIYLPAVRITTEADITLTTEDGVELATETDTRADPWTPVPITEA